MKTIVSKSSIHRSNVPTDYKNQNEYAIIKKSRAGFIRLKKYVVFPKQ